MNPKRKFLTWPFLIEWVIFCMPSSLFNRWMFPSFSANLTTCHKSTHMTSNFESTMNFFHLFLYYNPTLAILSSWPQSLLFYGKYRQPLDKTANTNLRLFLDVYLKVPDKRRNNNYSLERNSFFKLLHFVLL